MKQNRIPRISTRGFYDLGSGKALDTTPYHVYPKNFFENLGDHSEIAIIIHGLRNNKPGALTKFRIAKKRLADLGYDNPVVGFSYDSNTKGVQYKSSVLNATNVGRMIAKKNGKNLAKFITDAKKRSPRLGIRLIGHSLGSEVIVSTLMCLKKSNIIKSVYFFGASIPVHTIQNPKVRQMLERTVQQKIINYYSPQDMVLKSAFDVGLIEEPLGYMGLATKPIPKYEQRQVNPDNHRFVSYAKVLKSFP